MAGFFGCTCPDHRPIRSNRLAFSGFSPALKPAYIEFIVIGFPRVNSPPSCERRGPAALVDAAGMYMDTNSCSSRITTSRASRTRISQLLAVADTDRVTVESDLYHEFNLSLELAVRLSESHRGSHQRPRRRRRIA